MISQQYSQQRRSYRYSKKHQNPTKIQASQQNSFNSDSKLFILEPYFVKDLQQKIRKKVKTKLSLKKHYVNSQLYIQKEFHQQQIDKIKQKQCIVKSSQKNINNKKLLFEKISKNYEKKQDKSDKQIVCLQKSNIHETNQRKGTNNKTQTFKNRKNKYLLHPWENNQIISYKNYNRGLIYIDRSSQRNSFRPCKLEKVQLINTDSRQQSLQKESPMIIKLQTINERTQNKYNATHQRLYTYDNKESFRQKQKKCLQKLKPKLNHYQNNEVSSEFNLQSTRYNRRFINLNDTYKNLRDQSYKKFTADNDIKGWDY